MHQPPEGYEKYPQGGHLGGIAFQALPERVSIAKHIKVEGRLQVNEHALSVTTVNCAVVVQIDDGAPIRLTTAHKFIELGSSPRLRGARWVREPENAPTGIIPALARSTSPTVCASIGRRDHPRACEEHTTCPVRYCQLIGSSPRLRGALVSLTTRHAVNGIIPALAGSTILATSPFGPYTDHPRACGEHMLLRPSMTMRSGSSPRLRGARCCSRSPVACRGIIPALAESTPFVTRLGAQLGDHPRACGEHKGNDMTRINIPGSSPRLRGALLPALESTEGHGIIPALAGSTRMHSTLTRAIWDHPRACGEHQHGPCDVQRGAGSSPRLRGARPPLHLLACDRGIIPALAGSTMRIRRSAARWWDHPRACGEH